MVHHHAITVAKVELSAVETTASRPGAVATLSAGSRALRLIGLALLLGWIDAVRLALLTERQFQARIVPSLPVQS